MNRKKRILVVGLNPAVQKIVAFQDFKLDRVNRAKEITYISGGKGANFAKASKIVGQDVALYQFSGGSAGAKYLKILKLEKVKYNNQQTISETRTCSTIISDNNSAVTELIEPTGKISESEAKLLLAKIIQDLDKFNGVAICGTFPYGIKDKFYSKIAKVAKEKSIPLLLDSVAAIDKLLAVGIDILKINLEELLSIAKCNSLHQSISTIFAKFDVKNIAITDGPNSAYLFTKNSPKSYSQYKYNIPKLNNVINPIGAGDTVSAILFHEIIAGKPIHKAFHYALAAGSASCLTRKNSKFDINIAKEISSDKITIQYSEIEIANKK